MQEKYEITEEGVKVRVDKWLSDNRNDLSRSRIQSLINDGNILVNDEKTKASYRLSLGDIICIVDLPVQDLELKPIKMDLDIIYEDHDIIVINKPKGLVVHPGAGNHECTLVHGLLAHCKDLSGINGVHRPGIVHRIDKDTSGLLVIAKNDEAHVSLSKQLSDKTMSRTYRCLVHGVIEHDYGQIDAPIGRDEKDRLKMAITSKNSKHAITHFKVLKRIQNYTYIECELETGRTHQIRVHMKYIDHPIVGDLKYAGKNEFDLQGQLLHAVKLQLVHPSTEEVMVFEAPLNEEFVRVLDRVGA